MKKLLALVLCVMLFVSVLSTNAFAAVDLSPAYQARTALYNAYGDLAGATAYVNTVKMVRKLIDNPNWTMSPWPFLNGAVSYQGLFQIAGPVIYGAYELAGDAFVDGVALDILDINWAVEDKTMDLILSVAPVDLPDEAVYDLGDYVFDGFDYVDLNFGPLF